MSCEEQPLTGKDGAACQDDCWTLGLVSFFVSLWLAVSGSSQSTLALPTNLNATHDLGHQTTSGLYFYPGRFVSRCEVGFFPLTEQISLREETECQGAVEAG